MCRVASPLVDGMFYTAGRGGLNAIEQGQYEIGTEVIQSLSASFASVQDLLPFSQDMGTGYLPSHS